jgi:hypothetical protein
MHDMLVLLDLFLKIIVGFALCVVIHQALRTALNKLLIKPDGHFRWQSK